MAAKARRKSGDKKESAWSAYFKKLHEKGIRAEDIAHDLRRSSTCVCNWKYGYTEPDFVVASFLELKYGIKVPQVA